MELLLVLAALIAGCLLAVQAAVNQQLNRAVGTPYGASSVQLLIALVVLAVAATVSGQVADVTHVADVDRWWLLVGGVASPVYITAGIVLLPRLGALTSVGLFVTGQVLASVALDLRGWLGVPRQPLGADVTVGALAVVLGISIGLRGQRAVAGVAGRNTPAVATPAARPALVSLGLVAGAGLPVPGAINAQLREPIGSPLAVGSISFTVASATILVVLAAMLAARRTPRPRLRTLPTMPWWGWLGGVCAATYVTATFLLIPEIGTAVTVALTVTGQQLASGAIDQRGWLNMPRRPVTTSRLAGLGLLIAGSVIVQLA
jgi:transporter family-2 protein